MTNEIKEILDNQKLINVENDYERIIFEYLANNCNEFDDEHIKQLVNLKVEQYKQSLDYITNLQEENERLKDSLETMTFTAKVKQEAVDALIKRIDKAIDYGNNCLENLKDQEDYLCESIDIVGLLKMIHKNYIKILQGEDK